MEYLTLQGAYGRKYTERAAIMRDWNKEKDFTIASIGRWMGKAINRQQMTPNMQVTIRFNSDQDILVINGAKPDMEYRGSEGTITDIDEETDTIIDGSVYRSYSDATPERDPNTTYDLKGRPMPKSIAQTLADELGGTADEYEDFI